MYVTRPLSMYRKSGSTLEIKPPDAPYSGYLVITDEEADVQDSLCWGQWGLLGLCKRKKVKQLPFPQDKILTIVYTSEQYHETITTNVWFIPVPDQPLSFNCYYVIRAKGRHKGKACRSAREGDIKNCCFRDFLRDEKPKPLNLRDVYQQFRIYRHHSGGFFAKSVAPDGLPPKFLRRKGWKVRCSSLNRLRLSEALGLETSLRTRLPRFDFPIFNIRSHSTVVGKWHCPFPFVIERKKRPKTQMRKSIFYTMTLEQCWEEIFSCRNIDNDSSHGNSVAVNEQVQREVSLVAGMEAVREDRTGFSWFKVYNPNGRRGVLSVGLSSAIVEHMRWVLEEGGWVNGGEEREVKVERVEENASGNGWSRFGCYVLVESFSLRRLDGSLVLKCSFRHTQRINCKWE